MKNKIFSMRSVVSLSVMLALLFAMTLNFSACSKNSSSEGQNDSLENEQLEDIPNLNQEPTISFTLKVTKEDGTTKTFTVKTDAQNVGDALVEEKIASGEKGADGWTLYTVDGETHKNDGKQWVLYVDGMRSPKGVSSVMVNAASDCFELRVEEIGE